MHLMLENNLTARMHETQLNSVQPNESLNGGRETPSRICHLAVLQGANTRQYLRGGGPVQCFRETDGRRVLGQAVRWLFSPGFVNTLSTRQTAVEAA